MAAINYVSSAASIDSNVAFSSYGSATNYGSLVWLTSPIAQSTLEQRWVVLEKKRICNVLTAAMVAEVQKGVTLNVLGVPRLYPGDVQSQLGYVTGYLHAMSDLSHPTGTTSTISSIDPNTGLLTFDSYTAAQLENMSDLWSSYANTLNVKLLAKMSTVLAVDASVDPRAALDQIYAITWTSVP